jgi:hypothetical protein
MKLKAIVVAISMFSCVSAFATTTPARVIPASQITQLFNITADVNSMLQLTAIDGSPLNPNVSMNYSLLTNTLEPVDVNALLATNAVTNNIVATMPTPAALYSGQNEIPLTVSMNGKTLSAAATEFDASTLFGGKNVAPIDFKFAPTTTPSKFVQGTYKGTVTVYLEQQTPLVTQ